MDWSKVSFSIFLLVVLFILTGDSLKFLPYPVRSASYQSRTFVFGLLPDWISPKDQNQRREREIEEVEEF